MTAGVERGGLPPFDTTGLSHNTLTQLYQLFEAQQLIEPFDLRNQSAMVAADHGTRRAPIS